jgi:hypothetical protein
MKQINLIALFALFMSFQTAHATWDIYKSGVSINGGYYDCQFGTAAPDFQHNYFGRFVTSGTLSLDFAEVLTYKDPSNDNACGATLFYRLYRTCDTPGSFQSLALAYCCNYGGTDCGGGACGPDLNNNGDQKWKGTSGINLLSGLTQPGVYILEVYYSATGATGSTSGCGETKYSSNSSNNYIAYFEYDINDSFSDGQVTSSPTWNGDTGNFTVIDNSSCSGLLGTETPRTKTVRLNVASGAGTQSMSSQIATWDNQQEWYFWMGRNNLSGGINYSSVNQQAFWLYANESDLESATVDGYRILMGEDVTTHVQLQRIDNGVATTVFTSTSGITNGLVDFGVTFKVTRSQTGVWTVYTSTLPTSSFNTQSTPTAMSCPEALSTVNHGGTTDNTYVPASNGYIGIQAMHSSGGAARICAEFDNIRFKALPPNSVFTIINGNASSINEDAALAGNAVIEVQLANPSGSTGATVDLVLTSGSAGRAGRGTTINTAYAPSYTTITLTWAANTGGSQYVYIDPDNNDLCDDIATLNFQLQNATGGTNAYVGTSDSYVLTIVDDNMGYDNLLVADFETGSLTGWTTTGTGWSADNDAPINGTNSLHHSSQASNGTSSIVYDLDDACLPGVNTTWRFNLKFQDDASANNNFQVFLAANETNLFSSTVDGYAVVIDQNALPISGTDEFIRLYRITDGAYASLIVNSTFEWVNNLNGGNKVGIEVVLAENGTWTLKVDANGDFDALVTAGSAIDATYGEMKYFGPRFRYTAGQSSKLRLDDVSISQKGCRQLWYSQTNGAQNANTVWSKLVSGPVEFAYPGRYSRFVVQSGHTISTTGTWVSQDITINAGGNIAGGTAKMKVFGNWINNGAFNAGSSTVTFKGNVAQSILGTTTFMNLTVDNDGSTVTCVGPTTANGVVLPLEGTLVTGGNLTINSDISNTGSIGNITGTVTGDIHLIRYIPSIPFPYGGWANVGCPILGQTVADWNDDIITTGFTGSDYPSSSFNNIRYYNESSIGSSSVGYTNVGNITDALQTQRGYFIWMQGAVQSLDLTGAIQSGNINHSLSYTLTTGGLLHDGWNLMTNPYPSEVDWNLVSSSLTGPKVYYVYDRNTSSYKYRNASNGTGTASRYIPHSQSFLVKVNATGQSLNYQESYKTATGTLFERSETEQSYFAMKLSKGERADEIMFMFNNEAIAGYDDFDVLHLDSPDNEAIQLSLNAMPEFPLSMDSRPYNETVEIPVFVKMPTAGTYQLEIVETQDLPTGSCLVLQDLTTGALMTVEEGQLIQVVVNAPFEGIRFKIFGQLPATIITDNTTCANAADGVIDVVVPDGPWSVSLTGGEEIYSATGSVTFDHLNAGVYTLSIANGIAGCGVNDQTIEVGEPLRVSATPIQITRSSCAANDGVIVYAVANTDWFAYVLSNAQGQIVREGTVEGNFLTEEYLPSGIYELAIYTTCESFIETVDVTADQVWDYTWSVNSLNLEVGQSLELMVNPGTGNSCSIQVQGLSINQNEIAWIFEEPGVYPIYIHINNGVCNCMHELQAIVGGGVNVDSVTNPNQVQLTQVGNDIVLQGQLTAQGLLYRMVDANGRIVEQKQITANTNGFQVLSSVAQVSKGIYYILVMDRNHLYAIQKLAIVK